MCSQADLILPEISSVPGQCILVLQCLLEVTVGSDSMGGLSTCERKQARCMGTHAPDYVRM